MKQVGTAETVYSPLEYHLSSPSSLSNFLMVLWGLPNISHSIAFDSEICNIVFVFLFNMNTSQHFKLLNLPSLLISWPQYLTLVDLESKLWPGSFLWLPPGGSRPNWPLLSTRVAALASSKTAELVFFVVVTCCITTQASLKKHIPS